MNRALLPRLQRIRTLPIRIKLTLLSLMMVFSLATILYLSWYRDTSLRQMNETRGAIISMDMMVLNLQRSQNDFVNLSDPRHLEEFSATFERFVESTEDLKVRFWELELPIETLDRLVIVTSEYHYMFDLMTELQTKIGNNQTEGLRKDMALAISTTESELEKVPNDTNIRHALHRQLVVLQLFSKDLFLLKQSEEIEHFKNNYAVMIGDVKRLVIDNDVRLALNASLSSYRLTFIELARAATEIGLDYDHGLRAEIERTVSTAHTTLNHLTNEVNVAIDKQEQNLNTLIGVLTGSFSLAFMMALVFLGRSISIPIRRVTRAMTRLADGDLTVEISDRPRRDEIGDMLRALRVFKMGAIIRRRTQEELRNAHDELEHRVEERTRALSEEIQERRRTETLLERARLDAEEASKTKSLFLANVSHELRTPLNAIIGYSEMLQEDAADFGYEEISPDLDKINTAGKHLLGIINEILDLSKIEAGRIDITVESFLVQDVIDTIVGTISPLITANENTLALDCDPNLGIMETDVTRLRQILYNFLSNAAKFTKNGTITLSAHRAPDTDRLNFSVSDTGIGMNEEQLERVFDPFIQGDSSTTRKYGGTGLGLTVNREFARLLGGEVDVKSTPGKGSTFTICLPSIISEPGQGPLSIDSALL